MNRPNACLAILVLLLSLGASTVRACDRAAACAGKPCCCETKCKCDPCKCADEADCAEGPSLLGCLIGQVVGQLFASSLEGYTEAVPAPCEEHGIVLPAPRCFQQPTPCMAPNCPAMCMPEPLPIPVSQPLTSPTTCPMPMCGYAIPIPCPCPAPKVYSVKVRLMEGSACGQADQPCAHLKVCEGQKAEINYAREGTDKKVRVSVRSGPTGHACLNLTTVGPAARTLVDVKRTCSSRQFVPLDQPTTVELMGLEEGPHCAEVTVHEDQLAPIMVSAQAPCMPMCGPNGCMPMCGPNGCMPPNVPPCMTVPPQHIAMPMPYYPPMQPPQAVMPMPCPSCVIVPAPPVQVVQTVTSQFCIVKENGKSRLEMKGAGNSTTCVRLALHTEGAGKVHLAAGKKQVHVAGRMWKATADKVESAADGKIVLTGHVKLVSDKVGACACVKGEHVCVQLRDGRVEMVLPNKGN